MIRIAKEMMQPKVIGDLFTNRHAADSLLNALLVQFLSECGCREGANCVAQILLELLNNLGGRVDRLAAPDDV
jgi:hypothetical protein